MGNYHKLTKAQVSHLWQRRLCYPDDDKLALLAKNKETGVRFSSKALATSDDPIASYARHSTKPFKSSKKDRSRLPHGHTMSIDHVSGFKVRTTHFATSCYTDLRTPHVNVRRPVPTATSRSCSPRCRSNASRTR